MTQLKVRPIGSSAGVILSKEMMAKLRVSTGDNLYAVETPQGIELTAYDPNFAKQMEIAEDIMKEDRDVLKKLAE